MATQHVDECPSDLKPYGVIQYDPKLSHEQTILFQTNVREALHKLDSQEVHTSPVFQYLGVSMDYLEDIVNRPVAVMECTKCNRLYGVKLDETTQSDHGVGAVDNAGRRVHPIGAEHAERGLCGHWECARFKGLEGIHFKQGKKDLSA